VHTRSHSCKCAHARVCVRACARVCICACMPERTRARMRACTRACLCIRVRAGCVLASTAQDLSSSFSCAASCRSLHPQMHRLAVRAHHLAAFPPDREGDTGRTCTPGHRSLPLRGHARRVPCTAPNCAAGHRRLGHHESAMAWRHARATAQPCEVEVTLAALAPLMRAARALPAHRRLLRAQRLH
jgi:hypothetical protein